MNKQKVAVVIACVCCLTLVGVGQADSLADWEAAISAANPLHWYKFNETTGNDWIDSGDGHLGPCGWRIENYCVRPSAVGWRVGP